jgi:hypothetical protein
MHASCHKTTDIPVGEPVTTVANSNTLLCLVTHLLRIVVPGSISERFDKGVQ